MSENLLDEIKGTILAFLNKDGIKVAADSREWNEMELYNTIERSFLITKKIIGISVGPKKPCMEMRGNVIEWVKELQEEKDVEVSDVSNYIEEYLKNLAADESKDYNFGIMLAGHDLSKGFQIYRLIIMGNNVANQDIPMFGLFGSGSVFASAHLAYHYDFHLSNEDAKELAYKSVLHSSFYDTNTDGNIKYFEVKEDGISCEERLDSLQAYLRYYDMHNEDCVLFLIYSDKHKVCSTDDLVTYFSNYGDIIAAHCVDHRKAENGYFFHRLIFTSEEEVEKSLGCVHFSRNETQISKLGSKFSYEIEVNKIGMLLNKSTKELLKFIVDNSTQELDFEL